MNDKKRTESIKKILTMLDKAYDPVKPMVFRMSKPEYEAYKRKVLFDITDKYPGVNENTTEIERIFLINGRDVYESGFQWSCGTLAKAFCYANSLLNRDEQLDLKIMISTHPEHLIDSMSNHTLPCVKMGDGKYYAIEPGGNVIKNRPKHPGYPDIPFIVDEMVVGNTVHHIKKHMVENGDFPYEIRAIMTSDEYEKSCSDFGNFLRIASKRDKETQDKIIKPLEKVLGKINKDGHVGSTEDFCAAVQKLDLPIHIAVVKIGDKRRFQAITITINGDLYYFRHDHSYLMMHRVKDLKNNKMEDMDSGKEFMIESQCSPAKYLEIIKSQTHDFANEK